jgi:hypothetical protein
MNRQASRRLTQHHVAVAGCDEGLSRQNEVAVGGLLYMNAATAVQTLGESR